MREFNSDSVDFLIRKKILYYIITGFFVVLVFQLFNMQIIQHRVYDVKSEDNSIKGIPQPPLRGVFYDRNKEVLVTNRPSYTLIITPADYDKKLNPLIESAIGAPSGYMNKLMKDNSIYPKYLPLRVKRDVDFNVISWLEENAENLPGVQYIVEMQRDYPAGIYGSHMFGYLKEISKAQYEKEKDDYDLGDYVGNSGIEKTYEKLLRGKKGYQYYLFDSQRKVIGHYKDGATDQPSIKGYDLVLTVDADAQRAAEKAFEGKKGALVAIEPGTGEILAMVSAPEFDLNIFSTVTSKNAWSSLYLDPDKPLFNRATMSPNPPGSTFKVLAALAGLNEGVITPSTTVTCGGSYFFGGRSFGCTHVHGTVNVEKAIEKSCNVFFYQLIFKIGLDKWAEYAAKFGFGQKSDIDIGEEVKGILPNSAYYDKRLGKGRWNKGMMISLGIGQGELNVTQVQLAQFAALVANNGKGVKPHFVKGYIDNETHQFVKLKYDEINVEGIKQENYDLVKNAMNLVVNGAGTATWIKNKDIMIAGKTGTAQNPHGKDHAIFISFAPFENPKIAVAVLVENVGYGSTYAAPIARDVIVAYMKSLEKNKDKKNYQEGVKVVKAALSN
jgi:penicillin-binding protein 2